MGEGDFSATHEAPAGGLATWAEPDPARAPDNHLGAAVQVVVLEETTGWAHVRCENGWEAWVDAAKLVRIEAPPFASTHHVGASGADARERPDPTLPVTNHLDPGLPVMVVQRIDSWARVRCENDWEAWVDTRALAPSTTTAPGTRAVSPLAVWLPVLGAALAIGGGFLPWFTQGPFDSSAWDVRFVTLFTHDVTDVEIDTGPVLLVLVLAVAPLLTRRPLPRALALALAAIAVVIALAGFALYFDTFESAGVDVGVGLVVTLVGALVMVWGALLTPAGRPAPVSFP